jgi:hypothetical protein
MRSSSDDATLLAMRRRILLKIGVGSAIVVAAVSGGIALISPGLDGTKLSRHGRVVFEAIARAVLDGSLPAADAPERTGALRAHLARVDDVIAAFPEATRNELCQLIALLASMSGRVAIAGLSTDWAQASVAQLQGSLQLRQQIYHALRDLTNAAYFSDPATWARIGYPGPREL